MPTPVTELFNGGLVTVRHPALLRPGELQRADECVYREDDPAIWRAPGRTAYNTTALGSPSPIKGLAHFTFDGQRSDQLIAYVGTTLYRSDFSTITGSFSEVGGSGQVAGTISSTTTFTATTGYPFLADAIGSRIWGTGVTANATVTAVSNQSGSTGRYSTITISTAQSNGAITISLDHGVVQNLQDTNSDETLDYAQAGGVYYTWFNHGAPLRLGWRGRGTTTAAGALADILTMRPIGLNAVRQAPTLSTITGAWNTILGNGYYWFIITEIFAPGGDVSAAERDANLANEIVESAYLAPDPTATVPSDGRPVSIQITDSSIQGVRLTMPAVTNDGVNGRLATNWGIYMYGPTQDNRAVPSLALFRRIRAPMITQFASGATIDVTETSLAPQLKYATTRTSDDGQSEFANAANALGAPDRQVAFAKSGSATDSPGVTNAVEKLGGWGFDVTGSYATASIIGIEVQVTGSADSSGNAGTAAGYYMHVDTASKHTPLSTNQFGAYGTIYHGGPQNTLGAAWVVGDLSTITVTIGKTGTGSRQRLALDAVGLKIHFTGGTINLDGPPYRVVSYRDQIGTTVNDPANLPPPECSTGDIWQGSLVVDDLALEGAVRYSLPNRLEAFPKPYLLKPDTTKKDSVRNIKVVGQVLLIGMRDSIKRVNYLPRETDTDFQRGIAHEDLVTDHGIVGRQAAVKFDMPNSGIMLFYVAYNGVYITDGVTTRKANLDLNWKETVNVSNLATCVLRVYPREKWIVLYYNPHGAAHTENTKALIFSYAQDKIKEGGFLPAVGPITVSARSACAATLSGVPYLLTGHGSSGIVYVEDSGLTQATGYQVKNSAGTLTAAPISPDILTRRMYNAGIERDTKEERVYILRDAYGTTTTIASTIVVDSADITSTAAYADILPGMRVLGNGIKPGTIVLEVVDDSNITLSQPVLSSGTVNLSFDDGTITCAVHGNGIDKDIYVMETGYHSSVVGDLSVLHLDNSNQGLEFRFCKVLMPDLSLEDLSVNMRLHHMTIFSNDAGVEVNRAP